MPSAAVRNGRLLAVAAAASDDVWAVGAVYVRNHRTVAPGDLPHGVDPWLASTPLIEHWDGRRWTVVPSPRVKWALVGVTATAADDAWAVGYLPSEGGSPLVEHWDGQAWSRTPLVGIDAPELFAVGGAGGAAWVVAGDGPILHWDGQQWTSTTVPKVFLVDVAAISDRDVWAVGDAAAHWDGKRWRGYRPAAPAGTEGVELASVAAVAANDVWAVGSAAVMDGTTGQVQSVVVHWNGRRWTRRLPDHGLDLEAIAARSPTELWIVGLDERYNLAGAIPSSERFTITRSGAPRRAGKFARGHVISDLATDTDRNLWAVGYAGSGRDPTNGFPGRTVPLVERYGC